MTYMNPMAATQVWLTWTGALWAQQIQVSQIMMAAVQQNSLAMMGIVPLREEKPEDEALRARARAVSPRVQHTIQEAKRTRTRPRKPAALPVMPPRRSHAMPV